MIHPTESDNHFLAKCKKAKELYDLGIPFITEAWTEDRSQRFDLLDLDSGIDYEFETGKNTKNYKGDIVINISKNSKENTQKVI